jgi:hypothetical protein
MLPFELSEFVRMCRDLPSVLEYDQNSSIPRQPRDDERIRTIGMAIKRIEAGVLEQLMIKE